MHSWGDSGVSVHGSGADGRSLDLLSLGRIPAGMRIVSPLAAGVSRCGAASLASLRAPVGDLGEVVSETLVAVQRHWAEIRGLIACEPAGLVEVSRRRPWLGFEHDDEDPAHVLAENVIPEVTYGLGRDAEFFAQLANDAALGRLSALHPAADRLPVSRQTLLGSRPSCDEDLVVVANDDCAAGGDAYGSSGVDRLNVAAAAGIGALSQWTSTGTRRRA